jgi:hypothetical protein
MQKLKTYKPEYDPTIGIYCDMYEQYQRLTEEFVKGGCKDASKTLPRPLGRW